MLQVTKFLLLLLIVSPALVKCCGREEFHHIKITEKPQRLDGDKTFVNDFYVVAGDSGPHPFILPGKGSENCDHIQEYEATLKGATQIEIHGHFVPVLQHGDVQNLEQLQILNLTQNAIEEVQAGVFLNLPSLEIIDLGQNNIAEILKDVFNNLSIKQLILSNNKINFIAPEALDNLPNLVEVGLGHNQLKKWNLAWFTNTPHLKELSVSHNQLSQLPSGAFDKLQNSIEVLDLSHNQIQSVDRALFEHLSKLHNLSIEFNKISCLGDDVLDAFPGDMSLSSAPNENMSCLCWSKIRAWLLENYGANKGNVWETVRHGDVKCYVDIVEKLDDALVRLKALEKH